MEFAKFLTTYEAAHKVQPKLTKEHFDKMIKDNRRCYCCKRHVWRFAGTGLCFHCTTGESDPRHDYEVGEPY